MQVYRVLMIVKGEYNLEKDVTPEDVKETLKSALDEVGLTIEVAYNKVEGEEDAGPKTEG